MPNKIAVVGAGVAGLSTVTHLMEIWEARKAAGLPVDRLEITFVASLTLDHYADGSGLAGKAMSRSYEGPYDRFGHARALFYGPMMPHRGVIPHGYHVVWAYPNLRRMLGDGAADEGSPPLDGGLLRPKGGAGLIAVFQGNLDDPSPGGPGIALMGLSDPSVPASATRPATRALYRLVGTPLGQVFLKPFMGLFGEVVEATFAGVHPLFFADLFYAHEVDLEMRLALTVASLRARITDPERATVRVKGEERPLWDVEYTDDLDAMVQRWAAALVNATERPLVSQLLSEIKARTWLLEAQVEAGDEDGLSDWARKLLPDGIEDEVEDAMTVVRETERVLRDVPRALLRLASGDYPVSRTLHLRFGPDATFTSPYSFDAASAMRSLAFVFTTPRSARNWTPDGARIQRLWVRFWERAHAIAARNPESISLNVEQARVHSLAPTPDGAGVRVEYGDWLGHGLALGPAGANTAGADLSYPHTHMQRAAMPPPANLRHVDVDLVIPTVPAPILRELLDPAAFPAARAALEPLTDANNATLEIVLWTAERVQYGDAAARGLAISSITGLEGGFCLLADYSQGLWSPEALAEENPFGTGQFSGSVLESCGGFDDLWAALDRDDAWGWPVEVKEALRDLVARPEHVGRPDGRRWTADEAGWERKRASGTWSPERLGSADAMNDWWVASRYLAWQFLRQLSTVQALGARAVRQFAGFAELLDPRLLKREEILHPPESLTQQIRYVVMVNAKARNRIFSPGVGLWPHRAVSGVPLADAPRIFPAGDWTRNGLDVICMEAACLSGMRAARGAYQALRGEAVPEGTPPMTQVLPKASWYQGTDPLERPGVPVGEAGRSR